MAVERQPTRRIRTVTDSEDPQVPKVVATLQAHAVEVSELARDGMAAMMRSTMASMRSAAR